jgi:phosphoglycolate phosphatase-like HAD superfamily hydrolase
LYLTWAGELASPAQVEAFCDRFSQAVLQEVIDAPWVPGVREYLLGYFTKQYFVLVTATPQEEIEQVLVALELEHCFREVHGAPTKKTSAIGEVLARQKCTPEQALMVGDAETDRQAAQANAVPFLLRRTPLNLSMQATNSGPMFDDLNDE